MVWISTATSGTQTFPLPPSMHVSNVTIHLPNYSLDNMTLSVLYNLLCRALHVVSITSYEGLWPLLLDTSSLCLCDVVYLSFYWSSPCRVAADPGSWAVPADLSSVQQFAQEYLSSRSQVAREAAKPFILEEFGLDVRNFLLGDIV